MSHPPPPDNIRRGSAPARLCLGGEDLDWIGGHALMTAVELRVSVSYQPDCGTKLAIRASGSLTSQVTLAAENWRQPGNSDLELMRLCWQHATREEPNPGGHIRIRSEVPPRAGLASSATACVAALRALVQDHSDGWWSHYLVQAAYDVEHNQARRPVGPMDFVPAAFGGTTLVNSDAEQITDITHYTLPVGVRFLVVDTHTPRDTGRVIAWKRQRFNKGERGIRAYARRMPEVVAEQARILSGDPDLNALGQSINEAQTLLQHQMAVSTDLINTCVNRLRANGALGAKLTGTGVGGCLFALTTEEEGTTRRLATALQDLPVTTRLVEPAVIGATSGAPRAARTPSSGRRRRRSSSRVRKA